MNHAFITGTSSGLGQSLAEALRDQGWLVSGCSRRSCDLPGLNHHVCDLANAEQSTQALKALLGDLERLDLVVLNAGMLGEIRDLSETPLDDLKEIMEINLWANKTVLDWLQAWGRPISQIVAVSSGAAVLGNKGWGGYALSKAALNMLMKLYAHEFPDTHLCALAPGIIDTRMMDHLCQEADAEAFPALQRLSDARGTDAMPGPREAAERVMAVLPKLQQRPSGAFVDIREILDPKTHAKLYGARG